MANDLSVQFVDYLRQNKHLAPIDGSADRAGQGADYRHVKLWEITSLSPASSPTKPPVSSRSTA